MLKVAWPVPNNPGWIGGLNYFVNLAKALMLLPARRIEPVILGSASQLPEPLLHFNTIEFPAPPQKYSLAWCFNKLDRKINYSGYRQARIMYASGIKLFSHGWPLGALSKVPTLCWIPDFQHKHLPHMFTQSEIINRDISFEHVAKNASAVLLSSEDARKDFRHYFPKSTNKAFVLNFAADIMDAATLPAAEKILAQYNISEPFFHIPNQLWKHKNHGIVIDALAILEQQGKCPLVISTGNTEDYRNPEYFKTIQGKVLANNLSQRIKFLGLIPFTEVSVLMRAAIAMINPSLFEGWSTTVEEAKTLGKRLLLSDIAVHREQNPTRGVFFKPDNAEALAKAMLDVVNEYSATEEQRFMQEAANLLPERMRQFALAYEEIALKIV